MSDIDDDNLNVGENVLTDDINDNLEGGPKRTKETGRGKNTESIELSQDDATYRLTWLGYPFFVSGRYHSCGKFFPTHDILASHKDTRVIMLYTGQSQADF